MRKVMIMLIALCFMSTLVICEKAFAEKDTSNTPKSVKATEAIETTEAAEPTEATIPYSAPYDSPDTDTGADEVEVDEDV